MLKTGTRTVSYLVLAAFIVSYSSFALHHLGDLGNVSSEVADNLSHCDCAHEHVVSTVQDVRQKKNALTPFENPAEHHHCICAVYDFQDSNPPRRPSAAPSVYSSRDMRLENGFLPFKQSSILVRIYHPPCEPEVLSPQLVLISSVVITC